MEGKHTPGPHIIKTEGHYFGTPAVYGLGGKQLMASVYGENQDALLKNAELFRSAPALLEQVEKLKKENKRLDDALFEISSIRVEGLLNEVEKLKAREKELIEALDRIVRSWENSFDEKYAPWHEANELLKRIKQTT